MENFLVQFYYQANKNLSQAYKMETTPQESLVYKFYNHSYAVHNIPELSVGGALNPEMPAAISQSSARDLHYSQHAHYNKKDALETLRILYMMFISIIGTIGNFLIIGAIIFEKSLRGINNGWLFFINLAIIDLLITSLVIPLLIINEIMDHTFFGNDLCLLTAATSGICCHGAAATLTAIAITRYLSIIKPLSHRNILKIEYVILAIGLLWVFALCNSIPLILAWSRTGYDPFKRVCVCFDGTFKTHFVIGPIIIGHGLPHILTSYCYYVIIKFMRKTGQNVRKSSTVGYLNSGPGTVASEPQSTEPDNSLTRVNSRISIFSTTSFNSTTWSTHEKQVLYGNIIIVCFFSICWIPYSILILMGNSANLFLKRLFAGICLSSFALNAYVYGLISSKFRDGYKKTMIWLFSPFLPKCCLEPDSESRKKYHAGKVIKNQPTIIKSPTSKKVSFQAEPIDIVKTSIDWG